jgi:hypothetical protein
MEILKLKLRLSRHQGEDCDESEECESQFLITEIKTLIS